MALFRIRILSLLAVILIIALLARSIHGGKLYTVGAGNGWNLTMNGNEVFDFQNWADSYSFTVTDALDFGPPNPTYQVMLVSTLQTERQCDNATGELIKADWNTHTVIYNFTSTGQFTFINPNSDPLHYCFRMRFDTYVSAPEGQPGSRSEPLGPAAVPTLKFPLGGSLPSIGPRATTKPTATKPMAKCMKWILGAGVGAVVALALITIAWMTRALLRKFMCLKRMGLSCISDSHYSHSLDTKVDVEAEGAEWPLGPQRFSYNQLKEATNSFNSSLVVGVGGFGTVYKGYLGDSPGIPVAVKRLSQHASQGAKEFMSEVNIISQLRHRNLVQLFGWCNENEELMLVYEYMPNGDLDDHIFGSYRGDEGPGFSPLSWKCRYNIFVGVATALVYLHEEWEQRVVHRDVKTSNVMLDSRFNARLGDFGLARLSAHSQAPRSTLVGGTIGYLAPEFNLTGTATDKTDVYAFGVVILEVSCARRPLVSNCIVVDWVWDLHKEEKLLDAIDSKLDVRSVVDEEEMKRALQVGLLCCHPNPGARPIMRHVLNILTGETPLPKVPRSKPVAVFTEDPHERSY